MLSDIEIAQKAKMKPITEVAKAIGIDEDDLELYGKYKAKISEDIWDKLKDNKDGKLILVTAINPTPAGEGKTTITVGLGQAMHRLGKKAIIALREPSLGPVMGVKGGAAGGGYSQVLPMEDINLHFTGDIHAVTSANNLLCAAIDNHIHQGNELSIDARQIVFKRVMDMNDRALRSIVIGLGGKTNGLPREDGFMITAASEVMAVLCLSNDLQDLKKRLGKIIIGYTYDNQPVTASQIGVSGAMALLLKDAIKPNIVQTTQNTSCFMHGGPFANIAHGCNSLRATKLALKLSDYVITEAGFGADLGAEKFFDIKCRYGELSPNAVVIVTTVRALKYNGGISKEQLVAVDLQALERGIHNLEKHILIIKQFNVPVVVAINVFETDAKEELEFIVEFCNKLGVKCALSDVFKSGGEGGAELAQKVIEITQDDNEFKVLYDLNESITDKIDIIVKKIYGGKEAVFSPIAKKQIEKITEMGYGRLPICMAKTQFSLSDNPLLLGAPEGFEINVREVKVSAGAGFVVVITGEIMTLPGLPKKPAAELIDIDENGIIKGLF